MSSGIYEVKARFGQMGLPLVYVVVAESPERAQEMLEADEFVKATGETCLIGQPNDPTPRVIR